MGGIYKIRKIGEWMILERLIYPRLRLFINSKNPIPEFIKVIVLEKSKASAIASALREINTYLDNLKIKWHYN